MQYLRLSVVLFCFFTLLYWVFNGTTHDSPLNASLDDPGSVLGYVGWIFRMIGYAFIATLFSITFWFLCTATKAGAEAVRVVGGVLAGIYNTATGASSDIKDSVIATENGKPVTLIHVLNRMNKEIQIIKMKTADMEIPPPPKSEAELLKEQLAEAQRQLAELTAIRSNAKPASEG